jgi:hypothetical protein
MQNKKPVERQTKKASSITLSVGDTTVYFPLESLEELIQVFSSNSGKSDLDKLIFFNNSVQLFYKSLSVHTKQTIDQTVETAMNELLAKLNNAQLELFNKCLATFVTKEDLNNVKVDLEKRIDKVDLKIDQVKAELNAKIDKVDAGLNAKIDKVDAGLNAKIDKVDAGLKEDIKTLGTSVSKLISSVSNARYYSIATLLIIAVTNPVAFEYIKKLL